MSQLRMRRPTLESLPNLPGLPFGLSLRHLQNEERGALGVLLATAFEDESWTLERVDRELLADPDVKTTYVIVREDRLVATASVQIPMASPETGYLHWVAADPSHRGLRLGYTISLAVLHELARLGCGESALLTDDHRLPAIKTYLNLGFAPENRDETHPTRWEAVLARLQGESR